MIQADIKKRLLEHCHAFVTARTERIRNEISAAQHSANEETKSTAGDKHETARAMAQLEVEMNSKQLAEAEKLTLVLNKISDSVKSETIGLGSLSETSAGYFYLSISIGKVNIDGLNCFIISAESPVGKSLLHKKPGDHFEFNGKPESIISIF